ncbi:hypothetical protein ACFOLL_03825 [Falsochrobactrum ovis]|uniref:Uncharacterized protein n=1 Tax=Falsochrobactrum ovis TaxID=1293442 RepID=A0A364JUX8_9HYPH|nr:hypothetical protein [Falsochrobactrum ovis]RAK28569.1 hypothetical protein C7374_106103 [Falsochrobactrum ovis]
MKKIALSLMLLMPVCSSSIASSSGVEASSGTNLQPDEGILRNWAIIKCQEEVHEYNGEDMEKVRDNAMDLSYSFRENPELHDRFNRCVEEELQMLKIEYNIK